MPQPAAAPPADALVVILTKDPVPGGVKTRLAPLLGEGGAAALHRAMVHETLRRVLESGLPCRVALAGDPGGDFAAELRDEGVQVEPQASGDLGARLVHALRGPGRRIALGTDCVVFEPGWLVQAARVQAPAAFGPSNDGGYWIASIEGTGGEHATERLFQDIPWSTEAVLERTLAAARQAGMAVGSLPQSYDVDEPADLERLEGDPWCPPPLRALIAQQRSD